MCVKHFFLTPSLSLFFLFLLKQFFFSFLFSFFLDKNLRWLELAWTFLLGWGWPRVSDSPLNSLWAWGPQACATHRTWYEARIIPGAPTLYQLSYSPQSSILLFPFLFPLLEVLVVTHFPGRAAFLPQTPKCLGRQARRSSNKTCSVLAPVRTSLSAPRS